MKRLRQRKPLWRRQKQSTMRALDELEKLVTKKKQQDDKKVLEAYHAGDKTADEIVAFI